MDQMKASNATFLDDNTGGKGKYFRARILQAGLVKYSFGVCLLEKDTIDKFVYNFVGCPVIIDHKDVTNENAKEERVGVISRVWFEQMDGWYWVEGIIFDEKAISLINDGYNVSCQYEISEYANNVGKKLHNGNPFDRIILNGKPEHLAIVKNPRYENAMIAVNALDATNKDDEDIEWITVKGNHIPIKKGQSKEEAVKEFINKQQDKSSGDGDIKKGSKVFLSSQDGPNKRIGTVVKRISEDVVEVEFEATKTSPARTDRYYIDELKTEKSSDKDKQSSTVDSITKDIDKIDEEILQLDGERQVWASYLNDKKSLEKGNFKVDKLKETVSDLEHKINIAKGNREKLVKERDELLEKSYPDLKNKDKQSDKDRIKISDLKSRKNEILKEYWEAKEGSSERERLQYDLDTVTDEIIRLEDKAKNSIIQAINEIKETDMFKNLFKKKENKMDKDELKSLFMECLSELTAKNEADEKKEDDKLADDKVADNEEDDKKEEKKDEEKADNKCKNEVVDKRDIIRQIMAIAGKEEASEDVKEIAKLAEKLAYDKSEADKKADNKCKNEDDKDDDKKVENEEKEDEKEKASNSLDDIIGKMSAGTFERKSEGYMTQKKAVELGDKLF